MPDHLSYHIAGSQQPATAGHRIRNKLGTHALATLMTAATLTFSLPSVAAKIEVLSTIKPVQMISQAITGDSANSELLLPPSASPHHYQLRPSEQRKLQQADVVLWIGPEFEIFLRKPVAQLDNAKVLQLMTADIESNDAEEHDHHHEQERDAHHGHDDHKAADHDEHGHSDQDHDNHTDEADHQHEHDHGGVDPHIWLSPVQATIIAERLTQTLINIDPENSQHYQNNLAAFKQNLASTDATIRQQLEPVKHLGYFVFHDAYSHFETHYGLNHLGAFSLHPGQPLGAKHLKEIQHEITEGRALCVFTEPQFKPDIIKAISRNGQVKTGELDPMGIAIPMSGNAYPAFLQSLADSFSNCLSK